MIVSELSSLLDAKNSEDVPEDRFPPPHLFIEIAHNLAFPFSECQPPHRGSGSHILMTLPRQPGKPTMTA